MSMEYHPAANTFPLVQGEDFTRLVEAIREHGQHDPILVCDDMILDGCNRYRACLELGIAPKVEIYAGDKPMEAVLSLNLHRRHLGDSQRAVVAALYPGRRLDFFSRESREGWAQYGDQAQHFAEAQT